MAILVVYYGVQSGDSINILITIGIGVAIVFFYKKWIKKNIIVMIAKKAGLRLGLNTITYSDNESIIKLKGVFFFIVFMGCNSNNKENPMYYQGEPVIMKKEYSLIPGVCMYTYEGYGRKETFEDKCDKYSVGDKLGDWSNKSKPGMVRN